MSSLCTVTFIITLRILFLVKRNLHRRLPGTLLVILVYFVAAGGVSSTFVSSFTFGGFYDITSMTASVNAITTAPTKIPSPADVSDYIVLQIQTQCLQSRCIARIYCSFVFPLNLCQTLKAVRTICSKCW
jgi:hypothetical protein